MATEMKEQPVIFRADSVRAILTGRKTQTRRVITRNNSRLWSPLEPALRTMVDEEFWGKLSWDEKREGLQPRLGDDGAAVLYNWDGDGVWRRFKPTWEPGQLLWGKEAYWAEHDTEGRDYAAPLDCGPCLDESFYENGLESAIQYCATPANPEQPDKPGHFWAPEEDGTWVPWQYYSKQSPLFMPKWASRLWLKVTSVRAERVGDISIEDALAEGVEAEECLHLDRGAYGCTDCMNTGLLEDPTWAFEAAWDEINAKRGFSWKDDPWVWVFTFETTERPNLWPEREKIEQLRTA